MSAKNIYERFLWFANYAEIMMEILKHGSDVEVIKPKSLRELIKSEAKKITKIY